MNDEDRKVNELSQKLHDLENRLKLLEQSLGSGTAPSLQGAVRVTGALELPKISRIKISEFKLVEIYNDCPQVLSSNAIKVSVTADSYRQITQGEIFLERAGHGNYWVIATEEEGKEKYWLLPNVNIRLNIHRMKTVKCLFKCRGEQRSNASEFTLSKPARVSLMPSGQEWKLEKQGVLEFGTTSRSSQLQLELERINEELKQLQSQLVQVLSLLKQADEERRQMRSQIEQMVKRRNKMSEILKSGQTVHTESSGLPCTVEQFLGSGGQGEVYRANLQGQPVALKWYFPHYLKQDPDIREQIETAIQSGPPSDRFLWPMALTSEEPGVDGFGYVMPLREPHYKGIIDLMKRRIEPTFRALATAGFELADSFFQLHAKGLCYRDISWGNVFFDPDNGHVLICDNDNVDIDKTDKSSGVLGTPRFMAPEIVRGEAKPSTKTDLFSLAVLLFYMLMVHHPLEGRKEADIHAFDLPAMTKLYGTEPLFIFDPNDNSNRPVPGYQDNALLFWQIYPQFLRDLFTKAFTDGLQDPNSRVQETEWRIAMIKLRDSIIYCPHCGSENFYDVEVLKTSGGKPNPCWSCQGEIRLPPRMRIGKNTIMLNHDTQLFPHHVDDHKLFDFFQPVAAVTQHPTNPNIWGLKNLSGQKWVTTAADGAVKDVESGRSVTLAVGTKINFGKVVGEIRV